MRSNTLLTKKQLQIALTLLAATLVLVGGYLIVYKYIYQKNIANIPVSVTDSLTTSTCFTFTTPIGYRLVDSTAGTRSTCKVVLETDEPGVAGTGRMEVMAVALELTIEDFFNKIAANYTPSAVITRTPVTVDGRPAGKVTADLGKTTETIYFIPDKTGKYRSNNTTVTGFVIKGSTAESHTYAIDTIVSTIKFK